MSEFASSHDPPFEPFYGFGFYKITHEEMKDIEPHKKIIMMEWLEVTYKLLSVRKHNDIILEFAQSTTSLVNY